MAALLNAWITSGIASKFDFGMLSVEGIVSIFLHVCVVYKGAE